MAGFEAWRADEAQSARPAASPTPERPALLHLLGKAFKWEQCQISQLSYVQ